jgi:hypothetical protein
LACIARKITNWEHSTEKYYSESTLNKIMAAELEETLKRLVQNKAVVGTMVMNQDGIPIKSTLDIHVTTQYSGLINQLVDQGRVIIENILLPKHIA